MARGMIGTLGRAAELSFTQWRLLAVAVCELLLARLRHATQATARILHDLTADAPPVNRGPAAEVDIAAVAWAIAAAAARVPWRSDCLIRVMAADRWLRRYNMRPGFYLGVTRTDAGGLEAHAWLRCGDIVVTGGTGEEFQPLLAPVGE